MFKGNTRAGKMAGAQGAIVAQSVSLMLHDPVIQIAIMAFTGLCSLNLIRILAQGSREKVRVWVPQRGVKAPAEPLARRPEMRPVTLNVEVEEMGPEVSPSPRLLTFEDMESADRSRVG